MCLSILDYSLYSFTLPHICLFIYLYPCLFIRGKHSLIWFYILSLVSVFYLLSTSSRLVSYPLCLSCCRRYTNSPLVFVFVHARLLSPSIYTPPHSPIYSFYSCLFIRDVHLLIWFTLLSLVSVFLFLVYFFSTLSLVPILPT